MSNTGEISDGYHTFNELYEYRMLYNAHAAQGWLEAGIPVVKSWRHSDGELCFGGGWFIVTATLPTGQVSNHYPADDWELFAVPEVECAPVWDEHTPADAADRLRTALLKGNIMSKIEDSKKAPMKFRKKPVTIEAMRFAGTPAEAIEVYYWIERNTLGGFEPTERIAGRKPWPESGVAIDPRDGRLIIATLEGGHWVDVGDWIIRGVAGEFYPIKETIFAATYEIVQP